MSQKIQSRNMGEVAVLPIKMNLQLFSDFVEEPADTPETETIEPDEPEGVEWEPFDSDKSKDTQQEVEKPQDDKPKQDHETNKAFQEMRKAKEEAERMAADAKRKAEAADAWVKENYGDKGINTWEDYQQALMEQRKRDEYAEKGIDYDEVKKVLREEIDTHPEVIKAKDEAQRLAVNSEIRSLKEAYPELDVSEVSSMNDLVPMLSKLPGWDQISKRVERGYELKDAYYLVHHDEIMAKRAAAAEQAARNKIQSKSHMKPSGAPVADDALVVPDDVLRNYRQMFKKELRSGKMTDADFIKHYKQSLRQKG